MKMKKSSNRTAHTDIKPVILHPPDVQSKKKKKTLQKLKDETHSLICDSLRH
jgi:hypothetical protein